MSYVYYRIYLDRQGKYVPVCMQDFDEIDYDQSKFLTDQQFCTEQEALDYIDKQTLIAIKLLRSI